MTAGGGDDGSPRHTRRAIFSVDGAAGTATPRHDDIAGEEPLHIRVRARFVDDGDGRDDVAGGVAAAVPDERTLSITLRTPDRGRGDISDIDEMGTGRSDDRDLALGYLFAEGVLTRRADVVAVTCPGPDRVTVTLRDDLRVPFGRVERQGITSSACGLCGKRDDEGLLMGLGPDRGVAIAPDRLPPLSPTLIADLPARLRAAQPTFARTGGLHAAGLFSWQGQLIDAREDIGRHNAVDKVLGARLWVGAPDRPLSLREHILVISGRAGFELVQKARMACIPLLVAVGAPSSMAVRWADEGQMTLVAFCRDGRFNVYAAPDRIAMKPAQQRPDLPSG